MYINFHNEGGQFPDFMNHYFLKKTSSTWWIVEHYYKILLHKNSGWKNRKRVGWPPWMYSDIFPFLLLNFVKNKIEGLLSFSKSIISLDVSSSSVAVRQWFFCFFHLNFTQGKFKDCPWVTPSFRSALLHLREKQEEESILPKAVIPQIQKQWKRVQWRPILTKL